jgi:hypothetical protein
VATEPADRQQQRAAALLCLATAVATLCLLPFAASPGPAITGPAITGFVLINQTALVIAYALSAWVLFAQFRRGHSVPLLLAAGGTLFTAAIVLLQLLSFPGVVAGGRLLGKGPENLFECAFPCGIGI